MNIFITYDAELWPDNWDVSTNALTQAFKRCIIGTTPQGDYGLPFQLRLLREHELNAVCFVEPLFSRVGTQQMLQDIVGINNAFGHDTQLHLHPEWSHRGSSPLRQSDLVHHMHELNIADQEMLLTTGKGMLESAGAKNIHAFRAGNFGANNDTLQALKNTGFNIDSSYNFTFLDSTCQIKTDEPLTKATDVQGIVEYPISHFQDYPGHFRHLQLNACSLQEIITVLESSYDQGKQDCVILLHSFELLDAAKQRLMRLVLQRFENLCRYLADNRDRFVTRTFEDLCPISIEQSLNDPAIAPVNSGIMNTARRMLEQALDTAIPAKIP